MKKHQLKQTLRKLNITLYDSQEERVLEDGILELIEFIEDNITEEELIKQFELMRFKNLIQDFETKDPKEFYHQHKKTLETNKAKQIVFCKELVINDFTVFKKSLVEVYPDAFYDESLRHLILEGQDNRCRLCHKDISWSEPHLHHVNYNKQDCERKNLVFLCPRCHAKTNSNREYWTNVLIS